MSGVIAGRRAIVLLLLVAQIVLALAAPLIAPHDPYRHQLAARLQPPSGAFLFGTDHLGRDVFSRVLYGGREMLFTLAIALSIAWLIGGGIGLFTITRSLPLDSMITLLIDMALALPAVLLALVLISAFGASLLSVGLTLGVIFIPVVARQVRGVGAPVLARTYIETVRSAGARPPYILIHHVIPAISAHLLRFGAIIAVSMMAIASALSFLGLARRPPLADWGLMLRDARHYVLHAPWIALFTGLAIVLSGLLLYAGADLIRKN